MSLDRCLAAQRLLLLLAFDLAGCTASQGNGHRQAASRQAARDSVAHHDGSSHAAASSTEGRASATPPTAPEILSELFRSSALALNPQTHLGCPTSTLGEYLALLVATGSEGDVHRFVVSCGTRPNPRLPLRDAALLRDSWICEVEAYQSDTAGESPWRYGLVFLLRRADRRLNPRVLACPGGS